MADFTIPGKPQRWQRAGGNGSRSFTPADMAAAKEVVQVIARAAIRERDFVEAPKPVVLRCHFYMQPPQRIDYKKRPCPTKVPDIDNLAKLIMDALNGIAYKDDAQVVYQENYKTWAKDDNPRTEVFVGRFIEW